MNLSGPCAAAIALWNRLRRDHRGNVLMIMGFAAIPLVFATGMAVDYARAARLQTKMNAAADAAALLAVSKPVMEKTNAETETITKAMFNSQVVGLDGLIYDPTTVNVAITGTVGASNTRTAVVTYHAQSRNAFAGVLNMIGIPISGSTTATSSQAPNIDFYMLLDVSQSMLLPATSAGLTAMVTATGSHACAFACHQTNLTYGSGNTEISCDKNNKNCISFLTLARQKNITLRTDLVKKAVQDLTVVATSTAAENNAKYRMNLSSFDFEYTRVWPSTKTSDGFYVDANLTNVKTHAADAEVKPYYQNNWRTASLNDGDKGTHFTKAFSGSLTTMPVKPGDGTNVPGDTPQAILFIVTDGMWDETRPSGGRPEGPIDTASCTTVKNRGIRIAILNTKYLPESASDSWSQTNVKTPYLSPTDKISPALIACASPGLFYEVTTDGDISAALAALFQKAVATAHLVQ